MAVGVGGARLVVIGVVDVGLDVSQGIGDHRDAPSGVVAIGGDVAVGVSESDLVVVGIEGVGLDVSQGIGDHRDTTMAS